MKEPELDADGFYLREEQSQLQIFFGLKAALRGEKDELDLNPENDPDFSFGFAQGREMYLNEQEKADLEDLDRTRNESQEHDMEHDMDFC